MKAALGDEPREVQRWSMCGKDLLVDDTVITVVLEMSVVRA